MGGATRESPGVLHDVRKSIFLTIATPQDPLINQDIPNRTEKPIPKWDGCGNPPLAIYKLCGRVKPCCEPRGGLTGEFSPTIEKYSPLP